MTAANITNYKGIEKVIVFGWTKWDSEQTNAFACSLFNNDINIIFRVVFYCLYMCVFFLVRIYPSALFSMCAFFHVRFFRVRFFPSALFPMRLYTYALFSGALFSYVLFSSALFSGHRSEHLHLECKISLHYKLHSLTIP